VTRASWMAVAAALLACVPEEGPLMRPGEDCVRCHRGNAGALGPTAGRAAARGDGEDDDDGPPWTAAGTLYASATGPASGVEGGHVTLTDASGRTIRLRTNQAGNFYTAESLAFPVRATVEVNGATVAMLAPVTYGGCNACHGLPAAGDAPGRLAGP
jgi:hypothetical protein